MIIVIKKKKSYKIRTDQVYIQFITILSWGTEVLVYIKHVSCMCREKSIWGPSSPICSLQKNTKKHLIPINFNEFKARLNLLGLKL